MSVFTKRRKKLRKQQKIEQKQKEENSKKFERAMRDHIETCKIIKKDYPGYDYMKPENALKLYNEIYNRIHHN